jgi:hypothetical protein
MSQQVEFTNGVNTGRTVYSSRKIIPQFTITSDRVVIITPYETWYQAGDRELGFNQQSSYGKVGDPTATLTFTWAIQGTPTYSGGVAGEASGEFAALYFL